MEHQAAHGSREGRSNGKLRFLLTNKIGVFRWQWNFSWKLIYISSTSHATLSLMQIRLLPQKMEQGQEGFSAPSTSASACKYVCDECCKIFANETYLKKHKKSVHSVVQEEHQKCPNCDLVFKSLKAFWQHVVLVHEKNNIPDPIISTESRELNVPESSSIVQDSVVDSVLSNLKPEPIDLTCDECEKTFVDLNSLSRHIRRVHVKEDKLLKCPKCGKNYKTNGHLKQHLQEVHSDNVYPCDMCSITLSSEGGLHRHKKNVHGIKTGPTPNGTPPIQCQYCPSVLYTGYIAHVQEEHSEHFEEFMKSRNKKPGTKTPCQICGKSYYDKSSLRRHVRREHTHPEKKICCPHCGKMFKERKDLARHLTVHKNSMLEPHVKAMLRTVFGTVCNSSMTCSICSTEVQSSLEARLHLYIKHPEKFSELITHKVAIDGLPCTTCNERFESRDEMVAHIQSEHPEREIPTCTICGHKEMKERDLNSHYKQWHPQESRHTCNVCKMSFNQRRDLEFHTKREHSAEAGQCPYCPEKHMRVKMHVTKKHPEKAAEYKKMWNDAIKEECEARKKFNQYLEQGPQKRGRKRRVIKTEIEDDEDDDGTYYVEISGDESNKKESDKTTTKSSIAQQSKKHDLNYKIEKVETHAIQIHRIPPQPDPEPEEPSPQASLTSKIISQDPLSLDGLQNPDNDGIEIDLKPNLVELRISLNLPEVQDEDCHLSESNVEENSPTSLCPKKAVIKLRRLTEAEIAQWQSPNSVSAPAAKPQLVPRKRRKRRR